MDHIAAERERMASEPRLVSIAELLADDTLKVHDGDTWGVWEFSAETWELTHTREDYNIDLDSCTCSAQVLDWICQLAGKTWCSDEELGHLVRAFDALLVPQANLCSWGEDSTIEPRAVIEEQMK